MLELLPLAALRRILNRSLVTTTSLEMLLMTVHGHRRRDNRIKKMVALLLLHAHVPSHHDSVSGRFLPGRFVPAYRSRPGSDPVMSYVAQHPAEA